MRGNRKGKREAVQKGGSEIRGEKKIYGKTGDKGDQSKNVFTGLGKQCNGRARSGKSGRRV